MEKANAAQVLHDFIWQETFRLDKIVYLDNESKLQYHQQPLLEYLMKFQEFIAKGQPYINGWIAVTPDTLPPIGTEVLGYNEEWIDADCNPDGICMCYWLEDHWQVAKYCITHDEWHTRPTGEENHDTSRYDRPLSAPTYWINKPKFL